MRALIVLLATLFSSPALAQVAIRHDDMRVSGTVSVWYSLIESELALDSYLATDFPNDFGFKINQNDGPEYIVSEIVTRSIEELSSEFSLGESFRRKVTQAAKKRGVLSAHTLLVFYNFRYDPELEIAHPSGKMQFLGSFQLSEE